MKFNIGKAKHLILLQQLITVPNGSGGQSGEWVDLIQGVNNQVWAELEQMKGKRMLDYQQIVNSYPYSVKLRLDRDLILNAKFRFIYNSKVFIIHSIIDQSQNDFTYELLAYTTDDTGSSNQFTCDDATANLINTAGTNISSTTITAGSTVNITAPDSTVNIVDQNGNNLGSDTVAAAITKEIAVNIQQGIEPLYTYNYGALNTGQDVSYAVGDDKWVRDNVFNPEITSWDTTRPWVFPVLDPNDPTKLLRGATASGNNIFGNKERFTDTLGGQDYTNDLVIDHYLGLMVTINTSPDGLTNSNWNTAILFHNDRNFQGFSDWFMGNWIMYELIANKNTTKGLNYSPFNYNENSTAGADVAQLFTSTTSKNKTTNISVYANGYNQGIFDLSYRFIGNNKSELKRKGLSFRKAFTYDPQQDTTKLILL